MEKSSPSVSERVIQTVASDTDTDPLELPRLYDSIDPETLDALVRDLSDGEVSFRYAGSTVTVESSGTILIDDRSTASDSVEEVAGEAID